MLEIKKQEWLTANGYRPINDKVIRECLVDLYVHAPGIVQEKEAEFKEKFSYYKRYGKRIMPYSTEYLERTSIEELRKRDRQNIWRFVIQEAWPIKQIISMWSRFSFRYL